MTLAYILILTPQSRTNEVLDELQTFHVVKEAVAVFGVYNIIVKVDAESQKVLEKTVFPKIRKIDGVNKTLILTVIDP